VDQKLRGLARRRAALDAEEAHLLRYAEELKLWRGFGSGGMIEYMERAMGYAPHTATERLRVARLLGELPLIAAALERGELPHSAARELSRVAVPDTEDVWIEATRGKRLREIEAMVAGRRPGDLPTDRTEPRLHRKAITIELSPDSYDIWRQPHALAAEEHGQRLADDELASSVFRKAYGGGRDIEVDPATLECAFCDAIHLGSLDATAPARVATAVTARTREQVLARDGHCCTVPGCRRNVGLDLHHIEYRSHGGGHDLRNMTTICHLHHKAVHFGKLLIRGSAPDHLTFEFRRPRNRLNATDDDVPPPVVGRAAPIRGASPSGVMPLTGTAGPTDRSRVGSVVGARGALGAVGAAGAFDRVEAGSHVESPDQDGWTASAIVECTEGPNVSAATGAGDALGAVGAGGPPDRALTWPRVASQDRRGSRGHVAGAPADRARVGTRMGGQAPVRSRESPDQSHVGDRGRSEADRLHHEGRPCR